MNVHSATINSLFFIERNYSMKQLSVFLFVLMVLSAGCSETQSSGPSSPSIDSEEGTAERLVREISLMEQEMLTDSIAFGLLYMREEEKLARDMYTAFSRRYAHRTFSAISRSEQRHMDAIKILLDRYGLQDPVGDRPEGSFANNDLQALYDTLLAKGSVSLTEALKVGKLIEEVDIADLDIHRAELSGESDIKAVYENLRRASERHLRAFSRNL